MMFVAEKFREIHYALLYKRFLSFHVFSVKLRLRNLTCKLKMNRQQLIENIRSDVVNEIKPLIVRTTFESAERVQDYKDFPITLFYLIKKKSIVSGMNLIERNAYEYLLHNTFDKNLDFSHRLAYRMISASAASMTTSTIMFEKKNLVNFAIVPAFHAVYYGSLYMIQNAEESKVWMKRKFPHAVNFVLHDPILSSMINIIQKSYKFLNDPPKPYSNDNTAFKGEARFIHEILSW